MGAPGVNQGSTNRTHAKATASTALPGSTRKHRLDIASAAGRDNSKQALRQVIALIVDLAHTNAVIHRNIAMNANLDSTGQRLITPAATDVSTAPTAGKVAGVQNEARRRCSRTMQMVVDHPPHWSD